MQRELDKTGHSVVFYMQIRSAVQRFRNNSLDEADNDQVTLTREDAVYTARIQYNVSRSILRIFWTPQHSPPVPFH